jgi:hypothetical protein
MAMLHKSPVFTLMHFLSLLKPEIYLGAKNSPRKAPKPSKENFLIASHQAKAVTKYREQGKFNFVGGLPQG